MRNMTGAVADATPEARKAGVYMLEAGGNAFDAVVAAAVALAVTEVGKGMASSTMRKSRRPVHCALPAYLVDGYTQSN